MPGFRLTAAAASTVLVVITSGCGAMLQRALTPERAKTALYRPRDHVIVSKNDLAEPDARKLDEVASLLSENAAAEAIRTMDQLPSDAPSSSDRYRTELSLLYGIGLAEERKTEAVIARFSSVIEALPEDWRPYFHRWQLRLRNGDQNGAALDREAGMKLHPEAFQIPYSPVGGVL